MQDYKYEDGWRMISKYAFGTALYNILTNESVIISNDNLLKMYSIKIEK